MMERLVPVMRRTTPPHRATLGTLALIAIMCLAPTSLAREDGAPASALGTADAVRATSIGAAGLYFNPAGMGIANQYAVEAGYSYSDTLEAHALGAAAVDSRTNQNLALGVGYAFLTGQEEGFERDGHQIRAGFSTGWDFDGFGFRVGGVGRYLTLARQGQDDPNFFTLDSGIILEIMEIFRIGAVGQNLIDTKSDYAPRQVGVGAAFSYDAFQLSFDVNMDVQTDPKNDLFPDYAGGLQYLIAGVVVARAGFSMGGLEDHKTVAFGLGYVSPTMAADVSFSKRTDIGAGAVLSLALRYFLP